MSLKPISKKLYVIGAATAGVGALAFGLAVVASRSPRVQVERAGSTYGEYAKAKAELEGYPDLASAPRGLQEKVQRLETLSSRLDADMQHRLARHFQERFGMHADGSGVMPADLPEIAKAMEAESAKYERVYMDAKTRVIGPQRR